MKHHLSEQELFQILANHFGIPSGNRCDPHKHQGLRNAPPLLRVLKGGR